MKKFKRIQQIHSHGFLFVGYIIDAIKPLENTSDSYNQNNE